MRIAVLSIYSGLIDRGVETWTREYASRLSDNNDVLVLTGGIVTTDKFETKIIRTRLNRNITRSDNKLRNLLITTPYVTYINLSFALRSISVLKMFNPDIVQPNNGGIQSLIVRIFAVVFGWKVVITGHAGIGKYDKWNLLMRPHAFVSPSKRGRDWAKGLYFGKGLKIVNIPHAVDLKRFSKAKHIKFSTLERPIILCVSSLDHFKRVDLVVRAVSRLKKGSLLLIGEKNLYNQVDKLAEKLLGDRRFKHVQVKNENMSKYYHSSDLFTLVSESCESFGIAYLEAMASNLPIVATDDKLRREIIGDAGVLIDPEDINSYTKALELALQTDWKEKPRIQARKYSWDRVVNDYEKLFNNLIKR